MLKYHETQFRRGSSNIPYLRIDKENRLLAEEEVLFCRDRRYQSSKSLTRFISKDEINRSTSWETRVISDVAEHRSEDLSPFFYPSQRSFQFPPSPLESQKNSIFLGIGMASTPTARQEMKFWDGGMGRETVNMTRRRGNKRAKSCGDFFRGKRRLWWWLLRGGWGSFGPHNSRDTPGEEAGKLSLIKARSPSPSSSLDRLIRRIFFFLNKPHRAWDHEKITACLFRFSRSSPILLWAREIFFKRASFDRPPFLYPPVLHTNVYI